ncbi:MAG: hypothetical protein ACLGG0_01730 [Bacteriovoracia bacterium]
MKIFALILTLFSFSAFASFNDVECSGTVRNGDRARVEVERGFGGSMRDARVVIFGARGTNPRVFNYRIFQIRKFGTMLEFVGDSNFRLEVDLFPDQSPRWGRTYRGQMRDMFNVSCRFPNAQ